MNTIFGLLGQHLSHSISPIIHQILFEHMKIEAFYHLFEVEEERLIDAVKGLAAIGAKGVNVTVPYKIKVMKYIDKLSPEAEAIGSVNCITFSKEGLIGHNTDYFGFGRMLEKYDINPKGMNVTVLGNGGAAKTVIKYLLDHDADNITVVSRNRINRDSLANSENLNKLRIVNYSQLSAVVGGDIIINCTPCGMYPHINETPVFTNTLSNYTIAVDIIYNPTETMFLRKAREEGLKTVNGLYMLVSQAVAAQELWNGIKFQQLEIDQVFQTIKENTKKITNR